MPLGTSFPSIVVIDGIDTDIFPIYGTDRQSLSICIKEVNDAYTEFFAQNNVLDSLIEQLKAENQILWIQKMNNIRNRAMEIVNSELIYA